DLGRGFLRRDELAPSDLERETDEEVVQALGLALEAGDVAAVLTRDFLEVEDEALAVVAARHDAQERARELFHVARQHAVHRPARNDAERRAVDADLRLLVADDLRLHAVVRLLVVDLEDEVADLGRDPVDVEVEAPAIAVVRLARRLEVVAFVDQDLAAVDGAN